jgi:hypothetical protein
MLARQTTGPPTTGPAATTSSQASRIEAATAWAVPAARGQPWRADDDERTARLDERRLPRTTTDGAAEVTAPD